jgi:hypothetical protein
MGQRILLVADTSLSAVDLEDCRMVCGSIADILDEPVEVAVAAAAEIEAIRASLSTAGGGRFLEPVPPSPLLEAPMSSAEFIWREDGRPDWGAMWQSFCELALYGGPPHRGPEQALWASREPMTAAESAAVEEIRRGIWETTGLVAEPADSGWLGIGCESRVMAAWLCACIILENVEARCDGERLFLPAGGDYLLEDQVKSVITVMAKTHHYWKAHTGELSNPRRRGPAR